MKTLSRTKESKYQKDAIEYLEKRGAYVLKTHVGSYQAQGEPDLTVCYRGRYVAFELKVHGNDTSALQDKKLEKIARAGGIAVKAYTLEEIERVLNDISRLQQDSEPSE